MHRSIDLHVASPCTHLHRNQNQVHKGYQNFLYSFFRFGIIENTIWVGFRNVYYLIFVYMNYTSPHHAESTSTHILVKQSDEIIKKIHQIRNSIDSHPDTSPNNLFDYIPN
jgi:hypothetical protein